MKETISYKFFSPNWFIMLFQWFLSPLHFIIIIRLIHSLIFFLSRIINNRFIFVMLYCHYYAFSTFHFPKIFKNIHFNWSNLKKINKYKYFNFALPLQWCFLISRLQLTIFYNFLLYYSGCEFSKYQIIFSPQPRQ